MDHVFVNAPRAQEDGYHSMNTTANTVMRNGDNELEKAPYTVSSLGKSTMFLSLYYLLAKGLTRA
jgi:hypothetical protein